jgi:aminopeptidase N
MPALTESEARARAALLTVDSYDVSIDLTVTPALSRTVIRFRSARPGAASFADLTARVRGGAAVLNGAPLGPAADGRLPLDGLAAENTLTVEAEVPDRGLTRFAEPSGGGDYVRGYAYPTGAPDLFCCFDQLDLPAPLSLSVRVPAGWSCVANGAVAQRPASRAEGTWRFAPIRLKPLEFIFCAGPLRTVPARRTVARPPLPASRVALTSYGRSGLAEDAAGYLARFSEIAAGALQHYERELGVPCPAQKYEIVALPDVPFRAASVPGLMLVSEDLLARLADPDDDFAVMISAHEVAHLWFGALVGMRWWDDLWLEESLATYLSEWTDAGWTSFCYDEKPRALRADELPTTQPVSSPVATLAQARDRPNAITYVKGTAAVRQLAALIGPDTVTRGLADYLTRFGGQGSARLDDLVGCWSRASGRDLAGWADAWLRTTGTPRLAATLTEAPDATIASLTVTQDLPRPHRVGVALYDTAEPGRLRHRRTELVELTGAATELSGLAGEPLPAAVFVNAGDWALGQVTIDDRSLAALAGAAFDVGDPLTEAACWNAAWHMVLTARLAAAEYAVLVARRLSRGTLSAAPASSSLPGHAPAVSPLTPSAAGPLTPSAVEALLGRALTCADRYVPRDHRAAVRTVIADAAFGAARTPSVPGPLRRALLAGFAASAQTDAHLAIIRALLDGDVSVSGPAPVAPTLPAAPVDPTLPAAPVDLTLPAAPALRAALVDLTLRAALVKALAIRDLASPADLASLTDADPVAGRPLRTTCEAARPDPAAKEAAWTAALDERAPQWLARAQAEGIWIAGQESLLAGYRDRYFSAALPALSARDARGERLARRLADLLFPVTLDEESTMKAVRTAIEGDGLTDPLRAILQIQEAELRTAAEVRRA